MDDKHPSRSIGDWKSVWDDKRGRYYYYNRITRATQWAVPEEFKAEDASTATQPVTSTVTLQQEPPPVSKPAGAPTQTAAGTATTLPTTSASAWRAATDGRGKVYYYNKSTKETVWKRPAEMDDAVVAAVAPNPAAPEVRVSLPETLPSTASVPTPAAAIAPAPVSVPVAVNNSWKKVLDKKSGRQYYYNRETKETRWKAPEGWIDDAATTTTTTMPVRQTTDGTGSPASDTTALSPQRPVLRRVSVDTSSRSIAAVDNQATMAAALEKRQETADAKARLSDQQHEVANVKAELPDNWKEVVDAKSGRTYWYNKDTRETTWKRPTTAITSPTTGTTGTIANAPAVVADTVVPGSVAGRPLPPDGWREVVDKATGKTYYYEKSSKKTQWKPPQVWIAYRAALQDYERSIESAEASNKELPQAPSVAAEKPIVVGGDVPQYNPVANSMTGTVATIVSLAEADGGSSGFSSIAPLPLPPPVSSAANVPAPELTVMATVDNVHLGNIADIPVITVDGDAAQPRAASPQIASGNTNAVSSPAPPLPAPAYAVFTHAIITPPAKARDEGLKTVASQRSITSASKEAPAALFSPAVAIFGDGGKQTEDAWSSSAWYRGHTSERPTLERSLPMSPEESGYIPLFRNPPVSKRPDLHSVLISHNLEVERAKTETGTSPSTSMQGGSTLLEGVFPASMPGAALTPRSASLQLSGYLYKKSKTGWKGWLKRFFVTHRWLMFYYAKEGDATDCPLAVIDLRFISDLRVTSQQEVTNGGSVRAANASRVNTQRNSSSPSRWFRASISNDTTFEFEGPDIGTYTLRAPDQQSAAHWFHGLLAILHNYGCLAMQNSNLGMRISQTFGNYQPFSDPDAYGAEDHMEPLASLDDEHDAGGSSIGVSQAAEGETDSAGHIPDWHLYGVDGKSPRRVQRGQGVAMDESHANRKTSKRSGAVRWLLKKVTYPRHGRSVRSHRPTQSAVNAMRQSAHMGLAQLMKTVDANFSSELEPSNSSISQYAGSFEQVYADYEGVHADRVAEPGMPAGSLSRTTTPKAGGEINFATGISSVAPASENAGSTPSKIGVEDGLSSSSPAGAVQRTLGGDFVAAGTPPPSTHMPSENSSSTKSAQSTPDKLHALLAKASASARARTMSAFLNTQVEDAHARSNKTDAMPDANPWRQMYSEITTPAVTTSAIDTPTKVIDLSSYTSMILSAASDRSPLLGLLVARTATGTSSVNPMKTFVNPDEGDATPPMRAQTKAAISPLRLSNNLRMLHDATDIIQRLMDKDASLDKEVGLILPATTASMIRLRGQAQHKLLRLHQTSAGLLNQMNGHRQKSSLPSSGVPSLGSVDLDNSVAQLVALFRSTPLWCLTLVGQYRAQVDVDKFVQLCATKVFSQVSVGWLPFIMLLKACSETVASSSWFSRHVSPQEFLRALICAVPTWSLLGFGGAPTADGKKASCGFAVLLPYTAGHLHDMQPEHPSSFAHFIGGLLELLVAGDFPLDLVLALHAVSRHIGHDSAHEFVLHAILAPALRMCGSHGAILGDSLLKWKAEGNPEICALIRELTGALDRWGNVAGSLAGYWALRSEVDESSKIQINDAAVRSILETLHERGCLQRPSELCNMVVLSFSDLAILSRAFYTILDEKHAGQLGPTGVMLVKSMDPSVLAAINLLLRDMDTYDHREDKDENRVLLMAGDTSTDSTGLATTDFDGIRLRLLKFHALLLETGALHADSNDLTWTAKLPAQVQEELISAASDIVVLERRISLAFSQEDNWKGTLSHMDEMQSSARYLASHTELLRIGRPLEVVHARKAGSPAPVVTPEPASPVPQAHSVVANPMVQMSRATAAPSLAALIGGAFSPAAALRRR